MKKIISAALVAAIFATGSGSAFANVPMNTSDPKCIDITELGSKRLIEMPAPGKKVCGCKTCKVSLMTYDKMIPYVDSRMQLLANTDKAIMRNIQYKIDGTAGEINVLNVVLFTDSARAVISPFLHGKVKLVGNIAVGVVIAGESCCLLYYDHQRRKYEIQALEGKNEIANTKIALSYMKAGIEAKNYIGRNYYFVSMDNRYDRPDAIGTFAKKDDLMYPDAEKYNDEYLNQVKEHIDIVLEKIENGDFSTYKNFNPDRTRFDDNLKLLKTVAIPTVVLTELFELMSEQKIVDRVSIIKFLKDKVKNLSRQDIEQIVDIIECLYQGKYTKAIKRTGKYVLFHVLGSIPEPKNTHKSETKEEASSEEKPKSNDENTPEEKIDATAETKSEAVPDEIKSEDKSNIVVEEESKTIEVNKSEILKYDGNLLTKKIPLTSTVAT